MKKRLSKGHFGFITAVSSLVFAQQGKNEKNPLAPTSAENIKFMDSLPKNHTSFTIAPYDYWKCNDTGKLFRNRIGTLVLEQLPEDKILIQMSTKQKEGGWIHRDLNYRSHMDFYCSRKDEFFFLNEPPY